MESVAETAIVIAIGNSDDRLSQRRWSEFYADCNEHIQYYGRLEGFSLHGTWMSLANSRYQNAGWSLSVDDNLLRLATDLRHHLAEVLHEYGQDSMAWTVGTTTLVPAREALSRSEPPVDPAGWVPRAWGCRCPTDQCNLLEDTFRDAGVDPQTTIRVTCITHSLRGMSMPGRDHGRARAQAMHALDLQHQEQCR